MNQLNLNNNGKITFQEFLILLSQKMNEAQTKNLIFETFKYFDKDNDGIINIHDLSKIFLHLGEKITEQQLNDMLLSIDYDQDGYVTLKDFIQMTNQNDQ
jgi:Ca2+-binding EF-hand superfamily protein